MNDVPSIPGLSEFPELARKFRTKYRQLRARSRAGCADCEISKLIEATRVQLELRRRGDK